MKYEKAMIELIRFDNSDVISTSGCFSAAQQNSSHKECRSSNSTNTCEHGNSNGHG